MNSIDGAPRRARLPILAALWSIGLAAAASDCKLVNAQLEGAIRVCAASPVGLCSRGKILSGLLAGEFGATRDALAPGAGLGTVPPTTLAYSADLRLATAHGELVLRQLGVSDPDSRNFVELAEIVAGSGRLAGARGVLHVTGQLDSGETATGFRGKISGRYCID